MTVMPACFHVLDFLLCRCMPLYPYHRPGCIVSLWYFDPCLTTRSPVHCRGKVGLNTGPNPSVVVLNINDKFLASRGSERGSSVWEADVLFRLPYIINYLSEK